MSNSIQPYTRHRAVKVIATEASEFGIAWGFSKCNVRPTDT